MDLVTRVWDREIVDGGRLPALLVMVAFGVTFVTVRFVTHAIRAGRLGLRDLNVKGTHLHHLVPGILLLLLTGLVGIAVEPPPPRAVLAVPFGIGAALTLDEFALWLNLRDVYWSEEGRRSIDAVIVGICVITVVLLGLPFIVGVYADAEGWYLASAGVTHILSIVFGVVCVAKGKPGMALLGVLVLAVSIVGALRLGRPASPWARRWYGPGKSGRARVRYGTYSAWPWGARRRIQAEISRSQAPGP